MHQALYHIDMVRLSMKTVNSNSNSKPSLLLDTTLSSKLSHSNLPSFNQIYAKTDSGITRTVGGLGYWGVCGGLLRILCTLLISLMNGVERGKVFHCVWESFWWN